MKVEAAGKLISTSLSGAVRDRLIRLIAAGDLRPGDRLNEVHWAESFGISRGPIREAARELEGQGLLVSRINQGFYVANFTAAEIRDIYEAKDWMEAAFISDLAAHTDAATRKSVLADIDSIEGADRVEFNETLFQFRVRMSKHIHNRFLADLMLTLYRKFYILSALARTPEASGPPDADSVGPAALLDRDGERRRRSRPRDHARGHRVLAGGPAAALRRRRLGRDGQAPFPRRPLSRRGRHVGAARDSEPRAGRVMRAAFVGS